MKYVSHFISSYTSFIKGQANVKLGEAQTYICLWEKSNIFSCWKITKTYLHDCNKVATSRSNMEVLTGLLTVLFSISLTLMCFLSMCGDTVFLTSVLYSSDNIPGCLCTQLSILSGESVISCCTQFIVLYLGFLSDFRQTIYLSVIQMYFKVTMWSTISILSCMVPLPQLFSCLSLICFRCINILIYIYINIHK